MVMVSLLLQVSLVTMAISSSYMIPQSLTENLHETACTNPQQGQIHQNQVPPTEDSDHSDLSELSERSLGWEESLDKVFKLN